MTYDTINDAQTIAGGGTGTVLAGRYRVIRQLGHGGMGSVWLAEDIQLDNKPFAVKMLPSILVSNKRAYRQLKDEALVAMKLVHPNIVQIRAFEENNGNPFLVMDYIDGQTLDDYLAEKGKLSEDEVTRILKPIAAALDYAHGEGVIHRDVKPANVMIRKDGYPFILDFGIAREIQETMTRVTGKLSSGTLLYMSPEQLNGDPPKKEQDIYSFAAMAYECLKGEPPFVRGAIEDQIKNKLPEPLPNSPSKIEGVAEGRGSMTIAPSVMAGLAKKPEDRPKNCVAVLGGADCTQRREETGEMGATKTKKRTDYSASHEEGLVTFGFRSSKLNLFLAVIIGAGLLLQGVRIWLNRSSREATLSNTCETIADVNHRHELKKALEHANFTEARPHAEVLLKDNPNDSDANWAMGMAFFFEGQYAQAKKHLESCLIERPNDSAVWNNLAVIHLREKTLDEAERCANRALELLPDSAEVKDTLRQIKTEARRITEERCIEEEQHVSEGKRKGEEKAKCTVEKERIETARQKTLAERLTRQKADAERIVAETTNDSTKVDEGDVLTEDWRTARESLKIGGVVKSQDGAGTSVVINGNVYDEGDLLSISNNGIRFTWRVSGLKTGIMKLTRVRAKKIAMNAPSKIDTMPVIVGHKKVQLWEGGPYWAETNIGAEKPWESGYYFWWGDTIGYKYEDGAWVASNGSSYNFSFGSENAPTSPKALSALRSEGWITAGNVLSPEHDAAHVQWGGKWRTPTRQELNDLCSKCDWIWTTMNGVNGYVVRGRGGYDSASIFLPRAGYGYGTSLYSAGRGGFYWSSVPNSVHDASSLRFDSSDRGTREEGRGYGQSVRPVQGFTK